MSEKKKRYRNTAYDDALRTIEQECTDALLHFVNQIFDEHYDQTAVVKRLRNEHFIQRDDGETEKRIMDSHFCVSDHRGEKSYHLECESGGYDDSIMVRLFQYGASIAVEDRVVGKKCIEVCFPTAGLIVLRDKGNPPDHMTIKIITPGGSTEYDVPVILMKNYTLDNLFDKELYFLLPFYFFNLEAEFASFNSNEKDLERFQNIYCEIIERLRETDEASLSLRSKGVIIKQLEHVVKRLAYGKKNVKEKVGEIMGGKVLKMEWLEKYDAAVAEGEAKGREEGREEGEAERKKLEERNSMLEEKIKKLEAELKKVKTVAL